MKILYVSDLDGTLLQSNEKTSDFTNNTINEFVKNGMLFSYATARSYQTAHKVTAGLNAKIPLIVYNGAMIVDNEDGSFLHKNFFGSVASDILDDLLKNDIYPIVYSFLDEKEVFSYVADKCTRGMKLFLDTRKGDKRTHMLTSKKELYEGEIFYFTCIDEEEKLAPLYEKYKDIYHCVFQKDIYSKEQWLEIMPKEASKANAIRQLKDYLQCDKLVVFGDGENDMDMFELADEAYAVENAVDVLKQRATAIIENNNEDGVAKWLRENYKG